MKSVLTAKTVGSHDIRLQHHLVAERGQQSDYFNARSSIIQQQSCYIRFRRFIIRPLSFHQCGQAKEQKRLSRLDSLIPAPTTASAEPTPL